MFGLADRGNENRLKSVLVMFWFYWTYMVAIHKKLQTNEKTKTLVNKPKQELQLDITNQGQLQHHKHDHLLKTFDNCKRRIFLKWHWVNSCAEQKF